MEKMNRNGQFRDVTLRSVVANWASVSLILGAQPDFYSLWASGRPLICIPAVQTGFESDLVGNTNCCFSHAKAQMAERLDQTQNKSVLGSILRSRFVISTEV